MPLPAGTVSVKIHPAIGVARLSTNADSYVFNEPPHPAQSYKSNGLIKRQAVQFRLFAYGANNTGLQELTPTVLQANNLRVVWHARVANRKTAKERHDDSYIIDATARSDTNGGRLTGRVGDFAEGQAVDLGEIRPNGLFVPPLAQVYRRVAGAPIPASGMYNGDFSDNTSDGIISAQIIDIATNQPLTVPTLDAWVVVAPPDFAPDFDDVGESNLSIYLKELLELSDQPAANPVNQQAKSLDRAVIERCTSHFSPGIEVSLPEAEMFYDQSTLGDPSEARIRPGSSIGAPGTLPGEVTLGLCSPWQFDFRACTCSHWPNQRPDTAFKGAANGPTVNWRRRHSNDQGVSPPGGLLETNADFIRHVDKLGIIRKETGKPVEKERSEDIPPGGGV